MDDLSAASRQQDGSQVTGHCVCPSSHYSNGKTEYEGATMKKQKAIFLMFLTTGISKISRQSIIP